MGINNDSVLSILAKKGVDQPEVVIAMFSDDWYRGEIPDVVEWCLSIGLEPSCAEVLLEVV